MEYRKSYKGFILWLLGYLLAAFAPTLLPSMDADLMMRLIFNLTAVGIVLLILIMLRTESVYWINGVTFEQARDAGSERRRAFARAHLARFGYFALGYALFSAFTQLRGLNIAIDGVVFCVGLVAVALTTRNIKL